MDIIYLIDSLQTLFAAVLVFLNGFFVAAELEVQDGHATRLRLTVPQASDVEMVDRNSSEE